MKNIEVGIGGDLSGLRGRTDGRTYEGDFYSQLEHLNELLESYDAGATIDFVENRPPQTNAEEFSEVCLSFGMPVKQFSFSCHIGRSDAERCPLDVLRDNLELARRTRTVDRLSMQIWGDNERPTIEELIAFYVSAEELAEGAGIDLYTETHVNCFTYDPRRLIAVQEALLEHAGRGLRVNADLSHYVHQNGNTHYSNWRAISSGELNINPLMPDNYVSRNIISAGMVSYGHLRCAVPNDLPPGQGLYPIPSRRPEE